jgi:hypothetical protein
MSTRSLLVDGALSACLISALSIVFVSDRLTSPPPDETSDPTKIVGVDDVPDTGTLIAPGKRRPRKDSIYVERVAENRVEVAKKRGGSQISEQAVKNGLDWLARHQSREGFWSNKCLGLDPGSLCAQPNICTGPGSPFACAQTGLALLAFQGGGHFWFNETEYSPRVKKGLDWLVSRQQENGCLVEAGMMNEITMYEHAIATFALAEACATAKQSDQEVDPTHYSALRKAVHYIEDYQDPNGGGWRYQRHEAGDTSVSGWVVLALKSAKEADVKISPLAFERCLGFFKRCEMLKDGRTGYTDSGAALTEATTGVGMLVHHFLLEKPESPLIKAGSPFLANYARSIWGDRQGTPDYYLWYNCTLAMYLAGGENWDAWNAIVRNQLETRQIKGDGLCERGSWPPNDQYGGSGGRIYSTSLAILTLEVYYRFAKKTQ